MPYEVGDIVGWHVDVLHRTGGEPTEMRGQIIAIDGVWLCLRALHILALNQDPFVGRHHHSVHLIQKKAA